jgi:adenylylsulfate kinase-like enzyme
MNQLRHPGWALWFVGLPGSGKSSVAKAVHQVLLERGLPVTYLEMDARKKTYFPHPTYTPDERRRAYELFVREAAELVDQGRGVIMDGTAYQVAMRGMARKHIVKFAEVYLRCPLEVAMDRERGRPEGLVMAGLYDKALERMRTGKVYPGLGQVIGVDVPFEEDPQAECVVDSGQLSVLQSRDKIVHFVEQWLE